MDGRQLLEYLKSLDDETLGFPVVALLPLRDNAEEKQPYISGHISVLPNGFIGLEIPDARVERVPASVPDLWMGSQEGDVPKVSVDDLRNVWKLFSDVQARHPGEQMILGNDVYNSVCGPGADITAVWFRASMLWMLKEMLPEQVASWMRDGRFEDVVYEIAAAFPMQRLQTGIVREGPPFDVEEFVRQVEAKQR